MNTLCKFLQITFAFALALPVWANEKAKSDEAADVSQIEGQYWVAKDTDFKVVQNRLYTKEKRFSLSASYGSMINDQFSDAKALILNGNYHFSERWGVELNHIQLSPKDNSMVVEFVDRFGVVPNHGKFQSFTGVLGNWVPIYAKASFFDRKILYYDLSISAGLGLVRYDQQFTDKSNETQTTPSLAIDVVQQFFVSKKWALRLAYMIRFYKEEVRDSRTPFDIRSEDTAQTNFLNIGLTYFF